MAIWFTADHHFGHENIIRYCDRPFKTVNEMNRVMTDRWNEVVKPDDTVYVVGDFSLADHAEVYVSKLNGREILFVPGSHDGWMKRILTRYEGDPWERTRILSPIQELKGYGIPIVLGHYAMRTWPGSFHGSLHLYGHSHGRLEKTRLPRSMDVGVDTNDFYPYRLDGIDIERLMDEDGYDRG